MRSKHWRTAARIGAMLLLVALVLAWPALWAVLPRVEVP